MFVREENSMVRKAFQMKLNDGAAEEYIRRHQAIWPEIEKMIHEYGGSNYSIYLNRETNTLFGYLEIENEELWAQSRKTAICYKWWEFMADLMETNRDYSPVSIPLELVFHLD